MHLFQKSLDNYANNVREIWLWPINWLGYGCVFQSCPWRAPCPAFISFFPCPTHLIQNDALLSGFNRTWWWAIIWTWHVETGKHLKTWRTCPPRDRIEKQGDMVWDAVELYKRLDFQWVKSFSKSKDVGKTTRIFAADREIVLNLDKRSFYDRASVWCEARTNWSLKMLLACLLPWGCWF